MSVSYGLPGVDRAGPASSLPRRIPQPHGECLGEAAPACPASVPPRPGSCSTPVFRERWTATLDITDGPEGMGLSCCSRGRTGSSVSARGQVPRAFAVVEPVRRSTEKRRGPRRAGSSSALESYPRRQAQRTAPLRPRADARRGWRGRRAGGVTSPSTLPSWIRWLTSASPRELSPSSPSTSPASISPMAVSAFHETISLSSRAG